MKDHLALKEAEFQRLFAEYKKNPELFAGDTFVETPEYLRRFGIHIPGQELFPRVYLKLLPQDFIVEEISSNGEVQSVSLGDDPVDSTEDSGQTTFGTLVKCGLQTAQAIQELAKIFSIDPKQIQYAGLKDKEAITSQELSFHSVKRGEIYPVQLPQLVLKNVRVGKGGVTVGSLKGNRFTIVARTTEKIDETKFLKNIDTLSREGFYNFFYLQRFGAPRFTNFEWAIDILQGKYEKAVLSILSKESERDLPYFRALRNTVGQLGRDWGKIEEVLAPLPLSFEEELKMIRYLKDHPTDFLGALLQIPEQISLWVAALSSYLFNKKLTEYLETRTPLPAHLPLFLSADPKDWAPYQKFLEEKNIFPPQFQNLRPFKKILLRQRLIPTKIPATIHEAKIIPEGAVLSFTLGKGAYATTLFSHLFQLMADRPPQGIPSQSIDAKALLGEKPMTETLEYFKPFLNPKTRNAFEAKEE